MLVQNDGKLCWITSFIGHRSSDKFILYPRFLIDHFPNFLKKINDGKYIYPIFFESLFLI